MFNLGLLANYCRIILYINCFLISGILKATAAYFVHFRFVSGAELFRKFQNKEGIMKTVNLNFQKKINYNKTMYKIENHVIPAFV